LLILGFTFFLINFFIFFNNYRVIFISFILSFFLYININNYKNLFFDWNKQKQIIALLASSKSIEKGSLVIFNDHTKAVNALNRDIRFYEWNAILKYTYGDDSRFGINDDYYYRVNYSSGNLNLYFDSLYAAGSHKKTNKIVTIDIFSEGYKYYLLIDGKPEKGNFRLRDSFLPLNDFMSSIKFKINVLFNNHF
jgi:hypothetical protein